MTLVKRLTYTNSTDHALELDGKEMEQSPQT